MFKSTLGSPVASNPIWAIGVTMLILTSQVNAAPSSLTVRNPTCEFRKDPVGIDQAKPRLSWQVAGEKRGSVQTAYQILAATKSELLTPESADLWNSQERKSSETLQISYEGKPLKSNQKVYWTVRSWDQNNEPSAWSEPATFTVALHPADWKAQWIGTGKHIVEPEPIEEAKWIWSPESQDALDEGTTAGKPAGNAVRYFQKSFQLPAGSTNVRLHYTADNNAQVYLNAKELARSTEWTELNKVTITDKALVGKENTIAVRVANTGSTANSAGLILIILADVNGKPAFKLITDETWQSSRSPEGTAWPADLLQSARETANWEPARKLGDWGVHPWHKISRGEHPTLPIIRKEFTLDKPVRQALVHASGLGHYVLSINGNKIGDHYLDPAWSLYEKTVYYNSFDVTQNLKSNGNAIGVMLGKGFFNTSGDRRIHGSFAENPLALILQTEIEFEDGSTTTIVTDASWKWTSGPLTHNSILGGSDYDARLRPDGWDQPGFDDATWQSAYPSGGPAGTLKAASAPPMRTFHEFEPKSIEEPQPGHFVYDFGQNASAAPRLKVRGKAGDTIKLTWAEQRKGQAPNTNDGKGVVDQSGIGHGYFTYTLRGDQQDEEWFSELGYTGYQYLELTGGVPAGRPNPENKPVVTELVSVHVYSDQPKVGTFTTSSDMYNRIDRMIDWAVRSNLGHVFTDCPTREKLGWLEVPWLMWASVASRYDIGAYGEKIAGDIRDSQLPDGQILTVAPSYPDFGGGFHYTAEWGAAGVFVPWYTYQWYNDRTTLETNYEMMRKFVDYLEATSTDLIAAPGLGDWYDYWPGKRPGESYFTPKDLTSTAVFAGCADIISSSAAVLGKPDDQKKYAQLAADVRVAFNKKFRKGPGQYENFGSPQTAHAMAIVFDIVPTEERTACAQAIVDDLREREWQQTSGDVGYRFLINALSQTGHSDVIFKVLNRDKLGSYAYLVSSGWTSLPEAWNANPTSSMNHCMLGHIQEWFTQHLVGIAPAPESLGFDTILIQPTPGEGITSATGTYESPRGQVAVSWEQTDSGLTCDFVIPTNTRGIVRLPVPPNSKIAESGKPLQSLPEIKQLGRKDNRELLEVPSGRYSFAVEY